MADKELPWSGQRLLDKWNIHPTELAGHILHGLPAFRIEKGEFVPVRPDELAKFDHDQMTDFLFRPTDVEEFEKEYELPLHGAEVNAGANRSPEQARELGRLRVEKLKWDSSIEAAVQVGVFCANIGRPVVRSEVDDQIIHIDRQIPNTTMDKIWKALPAKYKKGAGRPKKE